MLTVIRPNENMNARQRVGSESGSTITEGDLINLVVADEHW
jgi:hypothetical protein